MLVFTILFSVLPAVLAMTQVEADKWCQDQRGAGFKAELDAAGNPVKCVTSSASCFGNEYKDPVDNQTKCCPVFPVNSAYSFDAVSKTGACCPSDTKWSYDTVSKTGGCCATIGHSWKVDPASGKGSCCTDDKIFNGSQCVVPKGPDPLPGPCPSHCGTSGGPKVAFCHGKVACPTETDLGIEFGKCYVLSFPDGKQLGRQLNRAYEKNGRYQDIPFKVCSSKFDCKVTGPVKFADDFSLQDQLGIPEDATGAKGWINNYAGGNHKIYTADKATAATFRGRPGCIGDGCSICINTDPKGLAIACPDTVPGLTSIGNPNYCQRLIFEQVACLD